MEEEKSKRQLFVEEIRLSLEAEYNAPLKPEYVEQVDRKIIKEKLKKSIERFQSNSNMSYKEIIQYLIDKINESRGVNPNAKGEHDVLEEVLKDMLEEGKGMDL